MHAEFHHAGRTISYLDVEGSGPSRHALVLLHAFPLAADMWRPQFAALPSGWRVVAPDLRGFGASSPDGPSESVSIDDYARDLVALLDHLQLHRVVVGGNSMGGYTAFAVLRLAAERVKGLVLADTKAEADSASARADRAAMLEVLATGGVAAVWDRMQPGLIGKTTRASRPDVVERVRHLVLEQPAEGVRRAIERMRSRPDSTPLLPGIGCPTLVIVGEEDPIAGVETARGIHEKIPAAELAVIRGAGHLAGLEHPREFNAVLGRFLAARF
jgi:pimeloyl-ACP methyl ester carboxylesterase